MQLSRLQPVLNRIGAAAAVVLIFLTIAWMVLLVYPSPPRSDAHPVERLAFIESNQQWQTASLIVAVLMAVAYLPLWAALVATIVPRRQTTALLSGVLGILYGPVVTIGYWTQYNTVRGLNEIREANTQAGIALAGAFEFSGNFWTGSYGIVIAGFVIWGLAALAFSSGLTAIRSAPARAAAVFFAIAGILAIAGAIGFASGAGFLEHGLLLSGVVAIPALASSAFMLWQGQSRLVQQATIEPVLQ